MKVNCLSKSWQTMKKRTRLAPIMIDPRNNTSQRSTCPIRKRKLSKRDAFKALLAATELVIDKDADFALPAMHYVQWFKHGLKPHSCFHRSSEVRNALFERRDHTLRVSAPWHLRSEREEYCVITTPTAVFRSILQKAGAEASGLKQLDY